MTHCLAHYKLTWRYMPGRGKVWIAIDRDTGKQVACHKCRSIAANLTTQHYANTHHGLHVVLQPNSGRREVAFSPPATFTKAVGNWEMSKFCQTHKGWKIYFSSEDEAFYATNHLNRQLGYTDSEAELLDEIDDELEEQDLANLGPFAYLGEA
jgi:hypothetical protein